MGVLPFLCPCAYVLYLERCVCMFVESGQALRERHTTESLSRSYIFMYVCTCAL